MNRKLTLKTFKHQQRTRAALEVSAAWIIGKLVRYEELGRHILREPPHVLILQYLTQ